MGFGNLGIWEIIAVAVIVLIFFGPRRLPEIARSSGKAIREFKRGLNEIQRELELSEEEGRRSGEGEGRGWSPASSSPSAPPGRAGRASAAPPSAGEPAPHPSSPGQRAEAGGEPVPAAPPGAAPPGAGAPGTGGDPDSPPPDPDQEELFGA